MPAVRLSRASTPPSLSFSIFKTDATRVYRLYVDTIMLCDKQPHRSQGPAQARAWAGLTPRSGVSLLLAAGTQEPWPSGQPMHVLMTRTEGQHEHLPHHASDSALCLRQLAHPSGGRNSLRGPGVRVAGPRGPAAEAETRIQSDSLLQTSFQACGETERGGGEAPSPAHSNERAQIEEQGLGVSGVGAGLACGYPDAP